MAFPEGQPTPYGRTGGRGYGWVKGIDIKAQMDRSIPLRVNVIQSHLDHLPDPVFVDIVHREGLDFVLLQDLRRLIMHNK